MVAFFLMHLISVQGWLIRAVTRTSRFAERRLLLEALLTVGLLLAVSSTPATADSLHLTDSATSFSLGPHLTLLEDPTASLSLTAVTQALHEGKGTPSTADVPTSRRSGGGHPQSRCRGTDDNVGAEGLEPPTIAL